MELVTVCVQQITVMFILIAAGYICGKTIISQDTGRQLSKLVLNVVNPMLIFMSYQMDYDARLMKNLMMSVLLGAVSYAAAILLSEIMFAKSGTDTRAADKFFAVYSNCGFMGIPLINGLFGSEGVFYLTGYLTCFNILVWTHGIMLYSGGEKKNVGKTALKVITSPSVIAIIAGIACFVLQIRLPELIAEAADYIGSMNTPLAMIVAGVTIAGSGRITDMLKNGRAYYISTVRLLIMPLIFVLMCRLCGYFGAPETVFMTVAVAAACPGAATGVMYAVNYDKNPVYASNVFALSTILSAVTLPLTVTLCGLICF
ncbi:MAG: AEC family transporter [Oscillospiraceae bacterium]|nr:AEC family transporter [Oscillospiraceae bacterium]